MLTVAMPKATEHIVDEIEKLVFEIIDQIVGNETYRISVEKRNSNISSQEIITKIAQKIKNKVDLENPDKIIQIEILGGKSGVSILRRDDILSVEKAKRSLSD